MKQITFATGNSWNLWSIIAVGLLYAVSACLGACSKKDDPPYFPQELPGHTAESGYDFTPELADATTRFVSSDLTLRYNDGGVLVQREAGDVSTVLRFVELATGREVEFACSGDIKEGDIIAPRLSVDRNIVDIVSACAHRVDKTGTWIGILAPGRKHMVLKF